MKISTMIAELVAILAKHGDLTVYMHAEKKDWQRDGDFMYPVNDFRVSEMLNLLTIKFNKSIQEKFHDKLLSMTDEEFKNFYEKEEENDNKRNDRST